MKRIRMIWMRMMKMTNIKMRIKINLRIIKDEDNKG